MKTKISLILSATLIGLALSCQGQGYTLHFSTNTLGVVFVDQALSDATKSFIVSDMQVCVQVWGADAQLRLREKPESAGYVDFRTTCPSYPEGIEFPETIVTNSLTNLALQIPKSLSDAYTNAIVFASANSNAVNAAYQFVAFVSSTNFASIPSSQMSNYVLFKNVSPNYYVDNFPRILSDLQCQTYYPPSVLGFYYSAKGPAATNLWLYVPCSSDAGLGLEWKEWSSLPAVWHDGKWKFSFWGATE